MVPIINQSFDISGERLVTVWCPFVCKRQVSASHCNCKVLAWLAWLDWFGWFWLVLVGVGWLVMVCGWFWLALSWFQFVLVGVGWFRLVSVGFDWFRFG